ncbi:serine hydrolase [uncultured Polaribacter sp.]|uniref:serine hydrolase domain-containing protein n=1 Tax=uncultured Polaribacter sp. TaxID=174711 RepID=UPI00261FB15E|nr:serine hydrolase domain-containing protein [uncultured Polaribacter sp.]
MKLFWKITIALTLALLIGVGVVGFWFYNKMLKVDVLEVVETDSEQQKIDKAQKWLAKLQKENKFNGAVLLIKNDSILLKETFGFTDFKRDKKLSHQSSFRLASLSKQFTAVGIMLLKEQGKLAFDDAITKYLPNLPYNKVTIRNLLNNTSGIPDVYMNFSETKKEKTGDFLTIKKMISFLGEDNFPLENAPNEVYKYNNTGYVLLAGIIEVISQQTFETFMQKELFDKLNMKNTRVWNLASKDLDFTNKTGSFFNFSGNISELKPGVLDGVAGDGGVFSAIDDFVIWNKFWSSNSLLSQQTMNEAFKKPILNNGTASNYGFGWVVLNPVAHSHDGSWLGARTLIIRNEQLKNCMVILDNSSSLVIHKMSAELVKVLK